MKNQTGDLRKQATYSTGQSRSEGDVQYLIEDLRTHQIELELQNEEMRRAQAELEEMRDKYVDLYDFSPVGHISTGEKGEILEANLTIATMLAVERRNLKGQFFSRFVSPEHQDKYYLHKNEILKTGSDRDCELMLLRMDGTTFHARLRSLAALGNDGRVRQVRTAIMDITAQKQAEDARKRSERELGIRNRIAEIFLTVTDSEMFGEVLRVVLDATNSRHGTFSCLTENGDAIGPSFTVDIWEKCAVSGKSIFFLRENWGNTIWARCILEKRTIVSSGPFNTPEGHVPVVCAMVAPILLHGNVIGQLLVGNKDSDYNDDDRLMLEAISD